jgi:FkbM family methyltransferase
MSTFAPLKRLIHRLVNSLGYEIRRIESLEKPDKAEDKFAPINVFDLVVQDLMTKRSDLFFVQIGAHDGLHYDPIHPYVRRFGWRGILVEPQPKIFAQLVENYRDQPQLLFENAAVADKDGIVTLYTFEEGDGLPEHATMLASFNRNALVNNEHHYDAPIRETPVAAISISTLLAKHNVTLLDLLQIDTEGYDFEILKMFDYSKHKPLCIHFESAYLDPDQMRECNTLLAGQGYRLLTLGIDTIAYQQEGDQEFLKAFELSESRE